MDLEKWLLGLPKPVLAVLMICVGIVCFMVISPMHTICQTQSESFQVDLQGWLLPQKVGKRNVPAKLQMALANCRHGNSSGSCYEYFNILRRAAGAVQNHAPECAAKLLKVSVPSYAKMEVFENYNDNGTQREELSQVNYAAAPLKQVLTEGLQMMVQQAWGEELPEPGTGHYGWFQDYELSVFCHVQNVVRANAGPDEYLALERATIAKLPGEKAQPKTAIEPSVNGPPVTAVPALSAPLKMASAFLTEPQIIERSLYGMSCANYR